MRHRVIAPVRGRRCSDFLVITVDDRARIGFTFDERGTYRFRMPPASDADLVKAGADKAINLCSTCHGPRGVSTSPEFPVLAGQQHDYLVAQLEAFRAKTRAEQIAHDFMWGIAGGLDDRMIAAVARYYAAQPPAPGQLGNPHLIEQGKQLFDKGVSGRGIPSCATCHGARAQGTGTFPRLAGQHAKYVRKQLEYIQGLVRNAPVMHGVVKDLTPVEIEAVAAYVQSLQ